MKDSNPLAFYERFLTEFIQYINEQGSFKEDFLDNLSLETAQKDAALFVSLCSNDEIKQLTWYHRKLLLQVLARDPINTNLGTHVVRLVKYLPSYDQGSLLDALVTEKDADEDGILMTDFAGLLWDDLNGKEFYEFVSLIYTYANEQYGYDKNPLSAPGINRKEQRYFQFDPSFWTTKPIHIKMLENGKIQFAFRHQFTSVTYEAIEIDPYASVTLNFEDEKRSDEFVLKKDETYTTSGILAYALCNSVITDNLSIGAYFALNVALMTTGIGELNAAMQAGKIGSIALAGTDMALGIGSILIETTYKDKLVQTENGKAILEFWETANTIWAVGRITTVLVSSATKMQTAADALMDTADDAEKAILKETKEQANVILMAAAEQSFNTGAGTLAKYTNLKFIYGGIQKSLGTSLTRFETALKSCSDEVMAKFNLRPDALYDLGNIEELSEATIKSRLDDIALKGSTFGDLETAAGKIAGRERAVLYGNINSSSDLANLKTKFGELDVTRQSQFLDDFQDLSAENLAKFNATEGSFVDAWKKLDDLGINEALRKNPDVLKSIDDATSEGLDGLDAIEDAIQISGKSKPTWPEIQALFKRGNDFNRKAIKERWYRYSEVHLNSGKRLDSYNPIKGEIVSRKATDLNNIQKSTFEGYLKELNNKYPAGTTIRSNKYPDIDGQQLTGKQILEIPENNQSFRKLQEYIDLAADYNVEIRFRPE